MKRLLLLAFAVMACGGPSSKTPTTTTTSSNASVEPDTCAGDSWLVDALGERPELSSTMVLDGMKRTRLYGPAFATLDKVEMDHLGDLQGTRAAVAETYQWEGPASTSSSSGHETSRVTVLRKAFGDPLALEAVGQPLYGAPSTLASGAMEYPPTKTNAETTFGPKGGHVIFTFADGTWVEVDQWMAQRFRASFATTGAPPLPPFTSDVAWEICGKLDAVNAVKSGVWGTTPSRGVLRFFAGREADVELLFRFASPDDARRAAGEQQARCARGLPHEPDKGIFSLVPPCQGEPTIEGPLLRYPMRITGSLR